MDYPFEVQHLAPDDGGGYLITFPDLPGCLADGGTVDEAIQNGRDAVATRNPAFRADNGGDQTPPIDSRMIFTPASFTVGVFGVWFVSLTWERGCTAAPTVFLDAEVVTLPTPA